MKILFRLVLIAIVLTLGLLPLAAQEDSAYVRAGHFAADAPAVDVYVNETLVVENLSYGEVSVWIAVPVGTVNVAVVATGDPLEDAVSTLRDVILEADNFVTVSAIGLLDENTFRLQPAFEDYQTPIESGVTRLTLFHAIRGMTGVDLVRNGQVALLSTVTYPDLALGNDGAASVEAASGIYDFTITGAGRINAVLAEVPELELPAGAYVSIFVYGELDAEEITVEVVTAEDVEAVMSGEMLTDDTDTTPDEPTATEEPADTDTADTDVPAREAEFVYTDGDAAYIRAAHMVEDAPSVDVYFDGLLTGVQSLEFTDVTDWSAIPAGTYDVAIVPAGESVDSAVLTLNDVEFLADSFTTLTALGALEDDTFRVQAAIEDYATPIEAGATRLTLFHAIRDMSGVDLVRNGQTVLLSTVTFPDPALGNDGAASVEAAIGTYNFTITGAGRINAVLLEIPEVELPAGAYVSIFVYGTLDDENYVIKTVTADDIEALTE
ncbi:MAG: DUF4397 domain-containing protein [Anaerolineae bacterium]|jgi:hypothetical protein|nr:DUF4397 domain-containing protein [Anaerolineae bacterium]